MALFGSDTNNDISPPPYKEMKNPVHMIALVAMGMPIIDNMNLEELAIACEKSNRYEFMITIAPLQLNGGTGSPINPIVMF